MSLFRNVCFFLPRGRPAFIFNTPRQFLHLKDDISGIHYPLSIYLWSPEIPLRARWITEASQSLFVPGSWEEPAVADVRPTARGLRPVAPDPADGAGATTKQEGGCCRWWEHERLKSLEFRPVAQTAWLLLFYSVFCFYHTDSSKDSMWCFIPPISRVCLTLWISWIESLFVFFLSCHAAGAAGSSSDKDAQVKSHYEQLLLRLQKDLESQNDQVSNAQQDLRMQREQVTASRAKPFVITPASALSHFFHSGGVSISLCSSELEGAGWAGVTEAAGCQAATAALDTAEEVRGQARRAGGSQNAARGRATQQSVNQGFIRSRKERSAPLRRKSKRGVQMAGRIKTSSVFLIFFYFRQELCEERKSSAEQAEKMRMELEAMDIRLEEKKKRSAELLQEVPLPPQNLAACIELVSTWIMKGDGCVSGEYAAEESPKANRGAEENRSSGATGKRHSSHLEPVRLI